MEPVKKGISNPLFKVIAAILLLLSMSFFYSCNHISDNEEDNKITSLTPVRVVNPVIDTITSYLELNATSAFLKKDYIKSNANGYVADMSISMGENVNKGEVLFIMQTKESRAIGTLKGSIDSGLNFTGYIDIFSPKNGVISTINHQKDDYVQDGEQLAVLSEQNSLVFLVDAPYEFHQYLTNGTSCSVILPDGEKRMANIVSSLPLMDVSSQTQNYIIKPLSTAGIPEGLIAKVRMVKRKKQNAIILPKSAVLTDEKQESFWVMKLVNDSVAVRVKVEKGIESIDRLEIISPLFSTSDRIISVGNYGLSDTARIKITK